MEDSSLPDTIEQANNQTCKARTLDNHAEAATWSGHTGPWTCTGGITPSTILPQSTHLLTPPHLRIRLRFFVHIKCSVPWWTGTAVELEAKGQASAQSTTGTVALGANKKKNKKNNDT